MTKVFRLPWFGHFYLIRVATVLVVLAIVAVRDTLCVNPVVYHPALFLFGAAYPHVVQLLLGRFEGRRLRGRYSLLVDGFFAGATMPVLAFSAVPCVVLLTINVFNWMALGGIYLAMLGISALLAGLALSGIVAGFQLSAGACAPSDFFSYGALLAYFFVVAWIVFRYSAVLQKHCDELQTKADAAEMGWRRAERALLSVLPDSVSAEHANGGIQPRKIADATLLLADFSQLHDDDRDLERLQTVFGACDEILFRHGLEAVKTFGGRYLALAGKDTAPDNALVAALEIVAYLRDHGMVPESSGEKLGPRLAIHSGPVVVGLVQAEKFNYDVVGTSVDEIALLVDKEGMPAVRISAAARARLRRDWRLAALSGKGLLAAFTPLEHGGS